MSTTTDPLSLTFAALADPTRRAILARLAQGEAAVSELAQPFAMSAPAISRHLRVLADAGLIERQVRARWRICRLRAEELRSAHFWLAQYEAHWEQNLDRLVDFLERDRLRPDLARPVPHGCKTSSDPTIVTVRRKPK
jgi:DNA-binding transcriptional ArsR family regulator